MFRKLTNLYRISRLYGLLTKGRHHTELFASPAYWVDLIHAALAIEEIQAMFKGYKTYIVAALMGALTVLKSLGYIDDATYQTLMALLGAGAVGTVAAKINRLANH